MSFDFSVGDLIAIAQRCVQIQDVHDTLAASYGRGDSKRVAVALESSIQKLELWKNTWLGDALNPIATSEILWGRDGWIDVQKLLKEIATTIQLFKDADVEPDDTKVGWKPIWKRFKFGQPKKTQVPTAKSPSILDLALELDKVIDQLWIHSEVSFESVHGIPPERHGPPARDPKLPKSLPIRQAAVALYQACQRSTAQCELDIDLVRDRGMPPDPQKTIRPASDTRLSYHVLFESAKPKVDLGDVIAEDFNFSEGATISPSIKVHEEPDLEVFRSTPPSNSSIIGIQPSYSEVSHYFRVFTTHPATVPFSETEALADELYRNKTSTDPGTAQSLSLRAKLDLAYDLVQCGFYLLGTPWLASLSSKRLRRINTKDGSVCALRVKTIPLDSLYLENPDALSESSQIFQIGMVLIEVALNGLENSEPARLEDPYLYASKMLPLVHKAIGWNYYRACAFCIQDRRSLSSYGRPQKFQYPKKTGWEVYLNNLLEDYHVQVVSR